MSDQNFYITTTLPYVNAEPHIGFALEIVAADTIARYQKLNDKHVIFNTGTDEHGQKIYQQALKANQTPQAYTDEYAAKFDQLKNLLNLSYTHFIRTTNPDHVQAAQKFWRICDQNGFIYKKTYQTKYCVGCELEKTDSELIDGKCPLHPNKEIELIDEENYFFKFSAFQQPLLDFYQSRPNFVKPEGKMNEIVSFVKAGLKDFSISRLKEKMPWGVLVPGDEDHVMYVWFDALVNYISTLGWPNENSDFADFWPGIQVCGKDNLRQQAAMWQAMLMAANLPNSKQILINGFISVDGQKMSKSLGNVISPNEMVDRYGIDGTRYLLMSLGPFNTDMDVSWEKLDTIYTAVLSNGLGNLCSRVAKMCEKAQLPTQIIFEISQQDTTKQIRQSILNFDLKNVIDLISTQINQADLYLSENEPWKKQGQEQADILKQAVTKILTIVYHLQPFMPQTAETIINHFSQERITAIEPLFPRLK